MLLEVLDLGLVRLGFASGLGDLDWGCLLSARIEVISVSSSTSSGSGDVGARDVVVVILGCWCL